MLGNADLVAFVPTRNPQHARTFYEHTLGLQFVSEDPFAVVFNANGVTLHRKRLKCAGLPAPAVHNSGVACGECGKHRPRTYRKGDRVRTIPRYAAKPVGNLEVAERSAGGLVQGPRRQHTIRDRNLNSKCANTETMLHLIF